jgi:hypothetical protein
MLAVAVFTRVYGIVVASPDDQCIPQKNRHRTETGAALKSNFYTAIQRPSRYARRTHSSIPVFIDNP